MSDIAPTTGQPVAPGTDGTIPAATPTAPATTVPATDGNAIPEGFELIRTEDKTNLISARDRANNLNDGAQDYVNTLAKRETIEEFLGEHKSDYPDVTRDDLMAVDDPEQLAATATRVQKRIEDAVQAKLLEVQRADQPAMTAADKEARLKQLRENPSDDAFAEMLRIQQAPTA